MRIVPTLCVPCVCILGISWGCVPVSAQELDPEFRPELVAVELTSREVRPGDQFALTLKFRNAGTRPARGDYRVFTHFEAPEADCGNIVIHADHEPTLPATMWEPGALIVDGPHLLRAPADRPEQEYFIHVGLFDHADTGARLLDVYDEQKLRVTSEAPPSDRLAPEPLSEAEIGRRREAIAGRIPPDAAVSLDGPTWRFTLDRAGGAWSLADKRTGVLWASDPAQPRFGEIELRNGTRTVLWRINRFDEVQATDTALRLVTRPVADGEPTGLAVSFTIEGVAEPDGIRLRWETAGEGDWSVTRVRPLSDALWVTEADEGRLYLPFRLGIELPADRDLPGRRVWVTYDSLTMAMCGAVKQGSALLVNWESVDTRLAVNTSWPDLPLVPGRRMRALSVDIAGPQGLVTVHPLGEGGYVDIAHAYRPLAREKGWLKTWADKRAEFPTVDRLLGAANFKPFVLSRVMPTSRFSRDGQERVHLGFTFDEVAACAEHWRHDLDIDRAFVVMAGWINGGYDVRHPDVLPAAPECGGNEALQAAFARIKDCGYLVGMHDNYQDMYEDAPSWDEKWLNKHSGGRPKMGGNWNGGQAWQVCAIKQVELAAREDTNLPKIAALFAPTVFFIDTTFAWGLVTCEDPDHPMTRQDDLEWKTRLCMLAKEHFGLFGSEEGREWAVPAADYLEGLFGHLAGSPPGTVIPLFNLVYSDCVQIMTHQGDRIGPGDEKKMADHILLGQMHLPRFGNRLYWTGPTAAAVPVAPLPPRVTDRGNRELELTYRWQVNGRIEGDHRVFVHFAHEAADHAENIAHQDDHLPDPPTSRWAPGIVEIGPRVVTVPEQFNGPARIMLGMTGEGGRLNLSDLRHSNGRYEVGTLHVSEEGIRFEPAEVTGATQIWARGDGGWTEHLGATDRVIKNTWEILSPLNLITAETPLTSHEFLTDDRLVQRTRFGDVTITVAYDRGFEIEGNVVPPYGFIVDSPTFIAFCATRYNGVEYPTGALFTARSLDGRPLEQSAQVRIYHGFGEPRVRIAGREFEVQREAVVAVAGE